MGSCYLAVSQVTYPTFSAKKTLLAKAGSYTKALMYSQVHTGCYLVPTTVNGSPSFNIKRNLISLLQARKDSVFCRFPSQCMYHYELFFFTCHIRNYNVYGKKITQQQRGKANTCLEEQKNILHKQL